MSDVSHSKPARVSVIVPHYPAVPGAQKALQECVASLDGYDELLVIVNDGIGYAKAVNLGLSIATGDFLVVVNNDTVTLAGYVGRLADPNYVTVPSIIPAPKDDKPRAYFCLPRWVYEEVGPYDENFEMGYFEDDDYIKRLELAGISTRVVEEVLVHHKDGGGMTMHHLDRDYYFNKNGDYYYEKWLVRD